jgi:hypothetical protein
MGRTYAKLPAAELDYQIMEQGDALAVGAKVWLSSASAGGLGWLHGRLCPLPVSASRSGNR